MCTGKQFSAEARVGYLVGSVVRQLLVVMMASGEVVVVVGPRPLRDSRHGGQQVAEECARLGVLCIGEV